ncbi:MAG: FAD-dependent oxidoreductase, partial [bacterium]
MKVCIIGAGLAGTEAAFQLAKRGIEVDLYEMRPLKTTGAHQSEKPAEFVCSNSLGSLDITGASGLLKEEMSLLGGVLIEVAKRCAVPAGSALAIDREVFSSEIER